MEGGEGIEQGKERAEWGRAEWGSDGVGRKVDQAWDGGGIGGGGTCLI